MKAIRDLIAQLPVDCLEATDTAGFIYLIVPASYPRDREAILSTIRQHLEAAGFVERYRKGTYVWWHPNSVLVTAHDPTRIKGSQEMDVTVATSEYPLYVDRVRRFHMDDLDNTKRSRADGTR